MAPVKLQCKADILKLTTAVHSARRDTLKELLETAPVDERKALEAGLLKRTYYKMLKEEEGLTGHVKRRRASAHAPSEGHAPDAVDISTNLEAELHQLQQEVLAASQRVVQLRSSVPVVLSDNLREKLEQCRPALEQPAARGCAEADAEQDDAECKEAALSPAAAELQGSFANAMLKMPTLRAKLEDALERLQRIMSAVAADAGQAPPNTVERAARGLATPGGVPAPAAAAGDGTPSPKLAEALSAGKIATRRRVASNLRPVPYPRH